MAFLDKVIGHGDVSEEMDKDYVSEFFFDDEEVIQSYQFIRDQIILTNYGIYEVDVQGLSGKKVEVKFFPKDTIKTISFETAGTLDFDVDIKIGVTNNTVVNVDGAAYSEPLSFKVPSSQAAEAKEVVAKKAETVVKKAEETVKKAEETAKKAETTVKAAAKTTAKKATKKAAAKKTAKAEKKELVPEVFVQFDGNEDVVANVIERAKEAFTADGHRASSIKSLKVYLKPEEYAAYYVINDTYAGKVNLF